MNDYDRGSKDTPTKPFTEGTPVRAVQHAPVSTSSEEGILIPLHIAFRDIGVRTAEVGSEELSQKAQSQSKSSSGRKNDDGKPRWDLLDAEFLDGIAGVLEFGARKYSAHNWRGGISSSRLLAASGRHYGALLRGEDIDAESGLPHWAHLGCCLMFYSWMVKHKPELDDRYKESNV